MANSVEGEAIQEDGPKNPIQGEEWTALKTEQKTALEKARKLYHSNPPDGMPGHEVAGFVAKNEKHAELYMNLVTLIESVLEGTTDKSKLEEARAKVAERESDGTGVEFFSREDGKDAKEI